jgi:hypothetical protein
MSALDRADYRVRLDETFHRESGLDPTTSRIRILEAIARLDGEPSLVVRRRGKDGDREIDIRPSLAELEATDSAPGFDCTIRFLPGAQGRPEEILSWILPQADPRLAGLERTGLWKAAGGDRLDPFDLLNPAAFPHRNGTGVTVSRHAQEDRDQRGAA